MKHSHSFEGALDALKKHHLKLTEPRKAILQILSKQHGPFTAEEIHKLISRRVCDQATVYRTLTRLVQVGILRRCEFGDGSARFELAAPGTHHHHVICNKCKRIEIVDNHEIEKIDKFPRDLGFSNVSHILEFFGICPQCKKGA